VKADKTRPPDRNGANWTSITVWRGCPLQGHEEVPARQDQQAAFLDFDSSLLGFNGAEELDATTLFFP
jgi:hypothetical protein